MWYPYVWNILEAEKSWTANVVIRNDRTRIQKMMKDFKSKIQINPTKSDGRKSMNVLFIHKMERNLKHLKSSQSPKRYCKWIRIEQSPLWKPTISSGQWQVFHLITISNSFKNCQHLYTPPHKAEWPGQPILTKLSTRTTFNQLIGTQIGKHVYHCMANEKIKKP